MSHITLTGAQFKSDYPEKYIIITCNDSCPERYYNKSIFTEGLNTCDALDKFNLCSEGMIFREITHFLKYLGYSQILSKCGWKSNCDIINYHIWDVSIPDDACISVRSIYENTFISNKLILTNKRCVTDDFECLKIIIRHNGLEINYIQHISFLSEDQTYELFKIAVQSNGNALQHIDKKERTKELIELSVKQDGSVLSILDETEQTMEICTLALQQNGSALRFVINQPNGLSKFIPNEDGGYKIEQLKSQPYSLCKVAVSQDGRALQFVEKENITVDLCKKAVIQNGWAILYISTNSVSKEEYEEIGEIAVRQNGLVLPYVKNSTLEIKTLAIEQNGLALSYINSGERTPDLCLIAVKQNGLALQYVPVEHITDEMCKLAIEQDGWVFMFVPNQTPELCQLAIKKNSNIFNYIYCKTEDLCNLAVKQNGLLLEYVDEENKTYEICKLAVGQNNWAIKYVPIEKRTDEILNIVCKNVNIKKFLESCVE